jgi:hypothetical protein
MGDGGGLGKPLHAKEIGSGVLSLHNVAMTAAEFEERIIAWARRRPDIEALVQIGSRVQGGGQADAWSDWDYQLIVRRTTPFMNDAWPEEIAPTWSVHRERTERGVVKASVVFAGGFEADFVPIAAWQMKLVYWAMEHPASAGWLPAVIRRGVANTRLVVCPGHRLVLGGHAWARRLEALQVPWPELEFSSGDFAFHAAAFWRHATWVQKKISRGEVRAALRWDQLEVVEHLYAMLQEEARLAGRSPRPEARKAEQWLDARRLAQTDITTSLDRKVLARALLAQIELFEEVSRSVATARGFRLRDYSGVAGWLRAELGKVLAGP